MFTAVLHFLGSNDLYRYEERQNQLEKFFSYFFLTSEQKYRYVQMRIVGKAYWWWEDSHNHIDCQD